tara:strand:- start:965 stop:1882 length:918 start_codon:yes stop_codon:yes gene_type:complete
MPQFLMGRCFAALLIFPLISLPSPVVAGAGGEPRRELTCEDILELDRVGSPSQLDRDQAIVLGESYDQGKCVLQDYGRAFELYSRAVEFGPSIVGLRLGYFYLNGLGVGRDENKARYWFRSQALAAHYTKDRFMDGILELMFFGAPVPKMLREEVSRAREMYDGPPEVLMEVYRNLLNGTGVFPNRERALFWLSKAARQDHPAALYDTAQRYLTGNGYEKDETSYVVHLREAARRNHAEAQKELGEYYLRTHKEPFELHNALVWLLRAQRNGLEVSRQVLAAGQLLDDKHREWAYEDAAEFDFSQ